MALSRVDLPTPDGPVTTLTRPARSIGQLLHADPLTGGHVVDRVADALVGVEHVARRGHPHQVDLVGDQRGRHVVVLGHHQEAVEHAEVRHGVGAGEDDQHLVDVGDQQVLLPDPARARLPAAELAAALLDVLDGAGAVVLQGDAHAIADDGQVGCLALLLQQAAQLRGDDAAVIGQHRSRSHSGRAGWFR